MEASIKMCSCKTPMVSHFIGRLSEQFRCPKCGRFDEIKLKVVRKVKRVRREDED